MFGNTDVITMTTIKYNVGDVVRRKNSGKEYLIENIELGYYTLSDSDCPIVIFQVVIYLVLQLIMRMSMSL